MKKTICTCVLMSLLAAIGCGRKAESGGGVAVIDLDKVATAMGWLNEMSKNIQAADTELRAQLGDVLRNSQRSVEDAKTQTAAAARLTAEQARSLTNAKDDRDLAGLPLTKEQRDWLLETVNKANLAWRTALNNYQQVMQGRRASLVQSYREKIRPTARRVAAERGMSVVLTTSDNLLYFDPVSVEITDQVVEELQKVFVQEKSVVVPPQPPASARTNPPAAK